MAAGCGRADSTPAALLLKLPHPQILLSPPSNQLVGFELAQLFELPDQRVMDGLRGRLVIRVRAANWFRDDLVDDMKIEKILPGDPKSRRGFLAHFGTLAVLP